jgi:hypothetical protein
MGVTCSIDKESHAYRISLGCTADFDQIPYITKACMYLDMPAALGLMIDMRGIELYRDRTAPIILALAECLSLGWPIALLANKSMYGIACMISVLARAPASDIDVFRCPDEASEWLIERQSGRGQSRYQSIKLGNSQGLIRSRSRSAAL